MREAPAHPEWSQGNIGTPGHKRGLDQVYMSPLRPLNRWLNITCHVSIIDKINALIEEAELWWKSKKKLTKNLNTIEEKVANHNHEFDIDYDLMLLYKM